MAKLVVLYKTPADAKVFDDYYFGTHIPLAKKLPGLRQYEVNAGPIGSPQGASPYHLMATLVFDSVADIQAAFGSAEGRVAAKDVGNFAQAGVEMLILETRNV